MNTINWRRVVSLSAAAIVALVAAYASFGHVYSVTLEAGQPPSVAVLMPLSIDGLAIVGAVAYVDGRAPKALAASAMFAGVLASLAANVLSAPLEPVALAVAGWPALALFLAAEILLRATPRTEPDSPVVVEAEAILTDHEVMTLPAKLVPVADALASEPDITGAALAARLGVSVRTAQRRRQELSARMAV